MEGSIAHSEDNNDLSLGHQLSSLLFSDNKVIPNGSQYNHELLTFLEQVLLKIDSDDRTLHCITQPSEFCQVTKQTNCQPETQMNELSIHSHLSKSTSKHRISSTKLSSKRDIHLKDHKDNDHIRSLSSQNIGVLCTPLRYTEDLAFPLLSSNRIIADSLHQDYSNSPVDIVNETTNNSDLLNRTTDEIQKCLDEIKNFTNQNKTFKNHLQYNTHGIDVERKTKQKQCIGGDKYLKLKKLNQELNNFLSNKKNFNDAILETSKKIQSETHRRPSRRCVNDFSKLCLACGTALIENCYEQCQIEQCLRCFCLDCIKRSYHITHDNESLFSITKKQCSVCMYQAQTRPTTPPQEWHFSFHNVNDLRFAHSLRGALPPLNGLFIEIHSSRPPCWRRKAGSRRSHYSFRLYGGILESRLKAIVQQNLFTSANEIQSDELSQQIISSELLLNTKSQPLDVYQHDSVPCQPTKYISSTNNLKSDGSTLSDNNENHANTTMIPFNLDNVDMEAAYDILFNADTADINSILFGSFPDKAENHISTFHTWDSIGVLDRRTTATQSRKRVVQYTVTEKMFEQPVSERPQKRPVV